jgi:signal transduction histidine kinase
MARPRPGRSREQGGTGLGLAIVKHLVQAQGGEIDVESGAGGTRFRVTLPAA